MKNWKIPLNLLDENGIGPQITIKNVIRYFLIYVFFTGPLFLNNAFVRTHNNDTVQFISYRLFSYYQNPGKQLILSFLHRLWGTLQQFLPAYSKHLWS